ncbi:metallophosphoesterase [uncultured Amnibacterium sp.]|uniref:metallophosphoesterase n=1 Tax=uncultured Amnibacterium sp. TaxID=1631851 RepID=UPI0035CAFF7E
MHDRPPSGSAAPVRVAGPALVLLIGSGAERAAVRAFAPEEVVESDGDLGPALEAERVAVVTVERYDAATVRLLVAIAQERDRPVDAVLVGDAAGVTLSRSRFRSITVADAASFVVDRVPGAFDHRDLTGPFDVVGDVHGCLDELVALLGRLGYAVARDDVGRAIGAHHPEGRTAVLVGDLVDRGPDVPGVLRLVMGMLASGDGLAVVGNHDDVLRRALLGAPVPMDVGLETSLRQLGRETPAFRQAVADMIGALPAHLLLDHGRLVVAHAGLEQRYHGHESARVRSLCLFGPTNGEADAQGMPVRLRWADDYRGRAAVVYGHTPTSGPAWTNRTICVDTGCVLGGALTAVRYPERTLESVPALAVHSAPPRPFLPAP